MCDNLNTFIMSRGLRHCTYIIQVYNKDSSMQQFNYYIATYILQFSKIV